MALKVGKKCVARQMQITNALHLPPDTGDCIASSGEILYCLSALPFIVCYLASLIGVETVAWSPFVHFF
jgi:hypothetical protein